MFSLKAEFSDKNICHYRKRARTCHLLSERPGCYHSTGKTNARDRIFKLLPINGSDSLIFTEFSEFLFHLGKTPLDLCVYIFCTSREKVYCSKRTGTSCFQIWYQHMIQLKIHSFIRYPGTTHKYNVKKDSFIWTENKTFFWVLSKIIIDTKQFQHRKQCFQG